MKGASNERKRQDQPWPKGHLFRTLRREPYRRVGRHPKLSWIFHRRTCHAIPFEEVSYLLIYGDLPTQIELADFDAKLKDARELPASVYDVIRATKDGHPMDVLRTATSALAALTPTSQDVSVEAFIENGIKLTSQVPMIIAAHDRIRNGLEPVAADKTLSHAANWLWMLKGEKPSEDAARLADVDFIPHAEHGSNASSFAARVQSEPRRICMAPS